MTLIKEKFWNASIWSEELWKENIEELREQMFILI